MDNLKGFESRIVYGTNDPYIFSPSRNFACEGASRVSVGIKNYTDSTSTGWQNFSYQLARKLAIDLESLRVIDFGTGTSVEFQAAFCDLTISKHLVDFYDGREAKSPEDTFHKANFSSYKDLQLLIDRFDDDIPTVFILADVIEHVLDPRPLLRTLRYLLKKNSKSRLLVTTPDRERVDGYGYIGIPSNEKHFREWNFQEIALALRSSGFVIESAGNIPQNRFDEFNRSTALILSSDAISQSKFFEENGLPLSSSHLIVTQEHAKNIKSGGIGSYIEQVEKNSILNPLILFTGTYGISDSPRTILETNKWFHSNDFALTHNQSIRDSVEYDDLLSGVEHLVFLYDEISSVEYQDYIGLGYRVAQAKKAGMLPMTVNTICYAHGSSFYLDNAADSLDTTRELSIDVKERIALELSDLVIFPSKFLEKLYVEDLHLELRNTKLVKYPISLEEPNLKSIDYKRADTLIFYGRPTRQKGFDLFVELILILDRQHREQMSSIKNIIFAGVSANDLPINLQKDPRVKTGSGNLTWAKELLAKNASRGIAVLPYRADNQPLSIYEMISAGMRFIAFGTGGIPEMLPESLHSKLLADFDLKYLVQSVSSAIAEPAYDRFQIANKCYELTKASLSISNDHYFNSYQEIEKREGQVSTKLDSSLSVVVINFNGKISQLRDALQGVKNLTYEKFNFIIIDDCSDSLHQKDLRNLLVEMEFDINCLHVCEKNVGLSAARNFALQFITTDFVLYLDNDNVVHNDFPSTAIEMLNEDDSLGCVTSWMDTFLEDADWNRIQPDGSYKYRPTGSDLGLGLIENTFGDASAVYRVSAIRAIGGWDTKTRAKWEDWQFYIRLSLGGYLIGLIPKVMISYRIRKDSMFRTYADFPGWLRLARSLPFPVNQQYSALRALHLRPTVSGAVSSGMEANSNLDSYHPNELKALLEKVTLENYQLRYENTAILNSNIWRIGRLLKRTIFRYPWFNSFLRRLLSYAHKFRVKYQ